MKRGATSLLWLAFGASHPPAAAAGDEIRFFLDTGTELRAFEIHAQSGTSKRIEREPADWRDPFYERGQDARAFAYSGDPRPSSAVYSPGCRNVLLEFLPAPGRDPVKPAEYGQARPWRKLGQFVPQKGYAVGDAAWSADSRYLVVMERKYRISKTPWSLFRSAFGHGDVLTSFAVVVVDTASGESRRIDMGEDFAQSRGKLSGPARPCTGSE